MTKDYQPNKNKRQKIVDKPIECVSILRLDSRFQNKNKQKPIQKHHQHQ